MTEIKEYNPYVAQGKLLVEEVQQFEIKEFNDLTKGDELLKKCQSLKKEIENKRKEVVQPLNDQVKQVNDLAKEVAIPVLEAENIIKSKLVARNEEQERIRQEKENKVKEAIQKVYGCKTIDELDRVDFDIKDARIDSAKLSQKSEIERRIREEEERKKREEEERKLEQMRKEQSEEQAKLAKERMEIERQQRELEAEKQRIAEEKKQQELKEKAEQEAKMKEIEVNASKVKGVRTRVKFEIVDDNLVPRSLCSPDEKKIRDFVKNGVKEIPGVKVWEEKSVQ